MQCNGHYETLCPRERRMGAAHEKVEIFNQIELLCQNFHNDIKLEDYYIAFHKFGII